MSVQTRKVSKRNNLKNPEQNDALRIGKLIRRHRKRRGLSQQQLSDQVNLRVGGESIYRQLISAFECGNRLPTVSQLKAICSSLATNPKDWL